VGLSNISKHRAQFKCNYHDQNGFFANIRFIYRSKWAVNNTNGNEVFDNGDEFAKGYISVSSAIGKEYKNGFSIQLGTDNVGNYVDAVNLPNLPGRTFYGILKYQLLNKK
jgi:outer membrane receptor for ferrienterochelin and colicins